MGREGGEGRGAGRGVGGWTLRGLSAKLGLVKGWEISDGTVGRACAWAGWSEGHEAAAGQDNWDASWLDIGGAFLVHQRCKFLRSEMLSRCKASKCLPKLSFLHGNASNEIGSVLPQQVWVCSSRLRGGGR